jgi:hypothetical protein
MSGTQTGFFDSLTSAVQENPLAAALIGGGALWLLIGYDKLKGAASSAAAAASPMVDIGARNLRSAASGLQRTAAPPTAPEMDHKGSSRVGETLRDAGNAASDAMSGAAEKSETGLTKVSPMRRRALASWLLEKNLSRKRNRRLPTCLNGNRSRLGRSAW